MKRYLVKYHGTDPKEEVVEADAVEHLRPSAGTFGWSAGEARYDFRRKTGKYESELVLSVQEARVREVRLLPPAALPAPDRLAAVRVHMGPGPVAYRFSDRGELEVWVNGQVELAPPDALKSEVLDGYSMWIMGFKPPLCTPGAPL